MKYALIFLALLLSLPAGAIVPASRSLQPLDERVVEIDASVKDVQAQLAQPGLSNDQQQALRAVQSSLEAEKKVLLERKEMFLRFEAQGLIMHLRPQ